MALPSCASYLYLTIMWQHLHFPVCHAGVALGATSCQIAFLSEVNESQSVCSQVSKCLLDQTDALKMRTLHDTPLHIFGMSKVRVLPSASVRARRHNAPHALQGSSSSNFVKEQH